MSHLKPKIQDLLIRQGSGEHFLFVVNDYTGTPFDPTGFRMQVRTSVDAAGTILSLTDADPEVTLPIDGSGEVWVLLTDTTTAALEEGDYVYDCEIQKDSIWYRICQGTVRVDPEVTRL